MTIETKNFRSPSYFSNTANNQFNIKQNLIGQDIFNVGLNANYIAMNGHYQIPMTDINTTLGNALGTSGQVSSFRFMSFINANMNERYWTVQAYCSGGDVSKVEINISSSTNASSSYGLISKPTEGNSYTIISQSLNYTGSSYVKEDVKIEATLDVNSGVPTAEISSFSMYIPPHTYINPTLTLGQQAIDIESLKPNKPIFSAPSKQISSIAGVANTIQYVKENVIPLKNIFTVTSPYETTAGVTNYAGAEIRSSNTTKNTSYALAYATAMDLTQSYKTVDWYAYVAAQDAAQPGRFELSSSYQVTGVNFSNTVPAWISGSIIIPTENLSLSSSFDPANIFGLSGSITYSVKKTVSTNTNRVSVWTIQLFEGVEL